MNSIEITGNKPEFIQNKERNYFLVISVKVEMSNHAMRSLGARFGEWGIGPFNL